MKHLILVFSLLVLVGCGQKFTAFEYVSANQSGGFTVTVNKDSILYNRTGFKTDTRSGVMNKKAWKRLKAEAEKVDLLTIDTLTAPSNDRAVDKAAIAYIKIYTKDSVYVSSRFDGLKPNAMLKPLTDSLFRATDLLGK